jgi:hypothetical protein
MREAFAIDPESVSVEPAPCGPSSAPDLSSPQNLGISQIEIASAQAEYA